MAPLSCDFAVTRNWDFRDLPCTRMRLPNALQRCSVRFRLGSVEFPKSSVRVDAAEYLAAQQHSGTAAQRHGSTTAQRHGSTAARRHGAQGQQA